MQKINSVEVIGVKPNSLLLNTSSNNNKDVIEVDITLEAKNRNTFINSCLTGEINYIIEQDLKDYATNIDLVTWSLYKYYNPRGLKFMLFQVS